MLAIGPQLRKQRPESGPDYLRRRAHIDTHYALSARKGRSPILLEGWKSHRNAYACVTYMSF